jgi:hypothetical protein
MGFIDGLKGGLGSAASAALKQLKGPDPARLPELKAQIADLKAQLKDVEGQMSKLEVGGWSAAAKAERAKNAPQLATLEQKRTGLIKDLYEAEKQISPLNALQNEAARTIR